MINMTTYKTIPEYINAFEDTLAEAQLDVDDDTNDKTFDLVPSYLVCGGSPLPSPKESSTGG